MLINRKPSSGSPLYKKRNLDYTDYAHREAVNRLKLLLAESYTPVHSRKSSICGSARYRKHDDSDDTDVVERPVLADISKFMPRSLCKPSDKYGSFRKLPPYGSYKSMRPSKDNLSPAVTTCRGNNSSPAVAAAPPPEILHFIEKQEGYIEQLEKESLFCRV